MKLGLFGGSFDPPHQGHLESARAACQHLDLDRVLFVPTADPPHKPDQRLAPASARYTMVELALLAEERLFASPHELTPGRRAYTVETLEHFQRDPRQRAPASELFLLLGADSFAHLHTWRRFRELPELARIVVLPRAGWPRERIHQEASPEVLALAEQGSVSFVPGPGPAFSSTSIRQTLSRGESLAPGALHPLVLDYVNKYRLYR